MIVYCLQKLKSKTDICIILPSIQVEIFWGKFINVQRIIPELLKSAKGEIGIIQNIADAEIE